MDTESEQVTAYRAEIEKLQVRVKVLIDLLYKTEAKANNHEELITELCDALDEYVHTPVGERLIQRAREATQ